MTTGSRRGFRPGTYRFDLNVFPNCNGFDLVPFKANLNLKV
jgi:hypothetical protein